MINQHTEKDLAEAIHWYSKAAEHGFAPAQNNLGILYEKGPGVPRDIARAITLFKLAAEQGDGSAAANLAYTYSDPHAGNVDISAAYFWALLALRNPSVLATPLSPPFAASLRNRLSPEDARHIEAQVVDWAKTHTPGVGTTANDWFVPLPAKSPSS